MEESSKQLVEVLMQSNNQFKDILIFAVSSIITLIVLFLGAYFFSMRSFKNEEISRVRSEIELRIQNDFISKIKSELREDIDNKISEKILTLSQQLESLNQKVSKLDQNIKNNKAEIYKKMNLIQADIYVMEGDSWRKREVYESALGDYIRAGKLMNDNMEVYTDLSSILNRIEECIEKIQPLSSWDRSDVQDFLNKIKDSKYNAVKTVIEQKITK